MFNTYTGKMCGIYLFIPFFFIIIVVGVLLCIFPFLCSVRVAHLLRFQRCVFCSARLHSVYCANVDCFPDEPFLIFHNVY